MNKCFMETRVHTSAINSTLENSIAGIRISKAFVAEEYENEKFNKGNNKFKEVRKHSYKVMAEYFAGEFIFMIFGLPGAALAMYHCAKPEKKKAAGGLLLSASLACMMTGITEPLEFSFLFVAPALFAVQVILAGFAYMIAHMLNIAVGLTFSGGLLDLFLFGILQGNEKTSWMKIIPVGIIYFFLYYFIFRFMIKKFDLKTPGREDDDSETKLYTRADVNARKENEKTGDAREYSCYCLVSCLRWRQEAKK